MQNIISHSLAVAFIIFGYIVFYRMKIANVPIIDLMVKVVITLGSAMLFKAGIKLYG